MPLHQRKVAHGVLRASPIVLGLWLGGQPLAGAVITVESGCTLADAIRAANTDAPVGGCPAGSAPVDTIVLTGDVLLDTVEESDADGNNGLPIVRTSIRIEGRHHTIARDPQATETFRILKVELDGVLELDRLTLTGGREARGGAIFARWPLTLTHATVTDNRAWLEGGGIWSSDHLTIRDSTFASNTAYQIGEAAAAGGAIYWAGEGPERLEIERSTFRDNRAGSAGAFTSLAYGGAIALPVAGDLDATLTVRASTFSGNLADGGSFGGGGAIFLRNSIFSIYSSTVSGNWSSSPDSGALDGGGGLHESTLAGNSPHALSGGFTARASLLADSSSGANCAGGSYSISGPVSLSDDSSCGAIPCCLTNLDPVLADNGGPTWTHALLEGSNALESGGACSIPTDQRGAPRVGDCDIGAYEYLGCPELVVEQGTVAAPETHEECAIRAGPDLAIIGQGGALTLRAGTTVTLVDGLSVSADASLTVAIDPSLQLLDPELVEADRARRAASR